MGGIKVHVVTTAGTFTIKILEKIQNKVYLASSNKGKYIGNIN